MFKTTFLLALAVASEARFTVNGGRSTSNQLPTRQSSSRSPVNSTSLQESITLDALLAHAQKLQDFAYNTPERNRLFGGTGHNNSVQYFYDTLSGLGDYYNVTLQPFSELAYSEGNYSLSVNGSAWPSATLFTYSPNGNVNDVLVNVNNLGCEASDFPEAVAGHIALISRGTCDFGLKSALAGAAKATAVVIYNNQDGEIAGTLGVPGRPEGDYLPTVGVDKATGLAWVEALAAGTSISASVVVDGSVTETRYTNNVIAETRSGDKDNVLHLGAHSDSVAAGPGINDNGSGSIALLEIAKQLANYDVTNTVRFSWWSAEEQGLIGSTYYVETAPEEELAKIRLYLNFDMIASPNYALAIYDGDGSSFNLTGPTGSAEAEKFFQDYLVSVGQNYTASEFSGRSDYGPFLDANIPSGGIDTGAEGIKTEEEQALFGGEAGVAYDVNYHGKGDTIDNLAHVALEVNTKAIAHAVASYGASFEGFPERETVQAKKLSEGKKASQFLWKGDTLVA